MEPDRFESIYGKNIICPNKPNIKNLYYMTSSEKRLAKLQPHIPTSLYNTDKYGSRIPEEPLPYDGLILFFGCSYTAGQGVNVKDSYVYRIAEQVKMNYYNLGSCGAGPLRCYTLAKYWIPKLKPDLVVYGIPGGYRTFTFEIDDEDLWKQNKKKDFGEIILNYEKYFSLDKRNSKISKEISLDAFLWLCNLNNTKFVFFDASYYYYVDNILDRGSDDIHPGPETHKLFANIILKGLDKPLIP